MYSHQRQAGGEEKVITALIVPTVLLHDSRSDREMELKRRRKEEEKTSTENKIEEVKVSAI